MCCATFCATIRFVRVAARYVYAFAACLICVKETPTYFVTAFVCKATPLLPLLRAFLYSRIRGGNLEHSSQIFLWFNGIAHSQHGKCAGPHALKLSSSFPLPLAHGRSLLPGSALLPVSLCVLPSSWRPSLWCTLIFDCDHRPCLTTSWVCLEECPSNALSAACVCRGIQHRTLYRSRKVVCLSSGRRKLWSMQYPGLRYISQRNLEEAWLFPVLNVMPQAVPVMTVR